MATTTTPRAAAAADPNGDDADADDGGAFTVRFRLEAPRPPGSSPAPPLRGLTMAVKDLYDVADHPTGFGSPAWLASHPAPATEHAAAVARLLSAGAALVGKTALDELAYSLNGENSHYGTPVNPAAGARGRVPGGSSSGSASAVGQGLADAALGSDTGGSVRVPASYCGLCGFRPTHGRVPMQGARPLAASFDTGGWLARDAATLRRVGAALLTPLPEGGPSGGCPPPPLAGGARPRWLVARDAFALASPAAQRALYAPLAARLDAVSVVLGGPPTEVDLAPAPALGGEDDDGEGDGGGGGGDNDTGAGAPPPSSSPPPPAWRPDLSTLAGWADIFRVAQAREIWREHGAWVTEARAGASHAASPSGDGGGGGGGGWPLSLFGPGVDDRLRMAASITDADAARAGRARAAVAAHLDALLGSDGVLVLPSAPGPAVRVGAPAAELDAWRRRLLSLTCAAGLAGLPQVSLPIGMAVPEDVSAAAAADGGASEGGGGGAGGEGGGAPLLLLPVGLSLIGPRGSDEGLLEIAESLMAALADECPKA